MSVPVRQIQSSARRREVVRAVTLAMALTAGIARGQEFPAPSGTLRSKPSQDADVFALRGPALYPRPSQPERRGTGWLQWSLLGLAGASAVTTLGAVVYREVHAQRWNDGARCLEPGLTRAEVCSAERAAARSGESVALIGGALTGLFTLGVVIHASF